MAGVGPKNPDVVIVSDSPLPLRRGIPTAGEPRKILVRELEKNDLMDSVYITNLVKCQTPDKRAPTPEEVRACKPYLEEELRQLDPKFVLAIGVPPTKALFRGKAKINQFHGEFIDDPKVRYIGMPTFHPAYTMRDPSKLPGFQNDIQRLARKIHGEEKDSEFPWSIVRRGNFEAFIEEFTMASEFAFDLETSGLLPFDPEGYITAIGIALPTRAWIIPCHMHPDFERFGVGPWRRGDALKRLVELLVSIQHQTKKKAYAWNGKFDNGWLRWMFGVKFKLHFDGMLASHTLDENTSNDLTSNCRDFLDVPEYDIPLKWKQGKTDDPMPNFFYCAQDCGYTFQLVKLFQAKLKRSLPLRRLFYKLVMPAARAMEDIEFEGLTIDKKAMEEIGIDLLQEKIQIQERLNEIAGRKVNWNSPAQVAQVLYDDLGLECTEWTKKKNPSTSETALLDLVGRHEVVDLLVAYRERAKFISTYINGFKKFMIEDKLYVSYHKEI